MIFFKIKIKGERVILFDGSSLKWKIDDFEVIKV